MSSGRSFRKVALEGRQKRSLRTHPALSRMMLLVSWKSSTGYVWLVAGVSAVGQHVLNAKAQGHSRSTHAFIYGHKPCPCPHWSHCRCYLCLGRWNASVLGYTGELVPHMADCSDRAESTRWGIHLCVAVAGLVMFFFPTGLCSHSLLVLSQHNYTTKTLPYSAEAKKIE